MGNPCMTHYQYIHSKKHTKKKGYGESMYDTLTVHAQQETHKKQRNRAFTAVHLIVDI